MTEKNKDELMAMIDHVSKFADQMMRERGRIAGMYHVVEGDNHMIVLQSQLGRTKEEAAASIRLLLSVTRADRYVYVNEAWLLITDKEMDFDKIDREGVEAQPGRVEVVVFQAEDHDRQVMGHRVISRDADGKPSLGPLVITPIEVGEGRLVGLMPPREQGRAN